MDPRTQQAIRLVASNDALLDLIATAPADILKQALREAIRAEGPTQNQWEFLTQVVQTDSTFGLPQGEPLGRINHLIRDDLLADLERTPDDHLQAALQRYIRDHGMTFNQRDLMATMSSRITALVTAQFEKAQDA